MEFISDIRCHVASVIGISVFPDPTQWVTEGPRNSGKLAFTFPLEFKLSEDNFVCWLLLPMSFHDLPIHLFKGFYAVRVALNGGKRPQWLVTFLNSYDNVESCWRCSGDNDALSSFLSRLQLRCPTVSSNVGINFVTDTSGFTH